MLHKTKMINIHNHINIFFTGNKRSVAVKKNIIGSVCLKGISMLVSLLLVPLTLGYVSAEIYGIWLTMSSVMIWMNFLDIGLTLGLKNKLAEAIAKEDYIRGKELVSTTYCLMLMIFVPLCLISIPIIKIINWSSIFNVSPVHNGEIVQAMYILVVCFSCQMITNVLGAVVSAFQKVALSNCFNVIGNIITLFIIYFLREYTLPSLTYLAFAVSITPIIVLLVASLILYNNKFSKVSPDFGYFNKSHIKDLLNLGAKFFIIQLQIIVLYQSTNILISNVSSPLQVTEYNIAYRYLGVGMMLFTIFLQPLWPAFTDAYTKKEYEWMNNTYKKMMKVFFVCCSFVLLMLVISPFVYKIWIGEKNEVSFFMTLTVALYVCIHSWDQLQVQLINGIGAVKLQTYITLIGLLVHIPMSFFLGKYIGSYGVITSMIIVNIIYSIIFTTQIKKILNNTAFGIWIK